MSTGRTSRRSHFERRLQIFLTRQFKRLVDPLHASLIAIENGADRTEETLGLLLAMGVCPGFPDLALLMPWRRIRLIEIKLNATPEHARTDLSDEQRDIHQLLEFYGHQVDIVRSAAEFWAIIDAEGVPHGPVVIQPEQLSLLAGPRRKRLRVPS